MSRIEATRRSGPGEARAARHLRDLLDDAKRALAHAPFERQLYTRALREAIGRLPDAADILNRAYYAGSEPNRMVRIQLAAPRTASVQSRAEHNRAVRHLHRYGWITRPAGGAWVPASGDPFGTPRSTT